MNKRPDEAKRPQKFKLVFSLIFCAGALLLMIGALLYSSWAAHHQYEADLPQSALPALGQALRTFHAQTGQFPDTLRDLDARLWKGSRASQISADGQSLLAPSGHYSYTYHKVTATACAIWAMPVGPRYEEAATHFWYLTPTAVEKWMGPALRREVADAVKTVPSEQQLRWLMMTPQMTANQSAKESKGGFSFLSF